MGEAFGACCRAEIAELYRRRVANALADARVYGGREARESDLLALAQASLGWWEAYDEEAVRELEGIARGSGLDVVQLVALGGLTDLRDALAWGAPAPSDCTAALVQSDASADGQTGFAQTWDLATDNAPFVLVVRRRPREGPETCSVTTVGCLSLIGMNEHGLTVGTTNLRTRDARPGVPYLGVIHRALRARGFAEALDDVRRARRAGAHSFLVLDGPGRAAAVECSATRSEAIHLEGGIHVQTNHCLRPANRACEAEVPRQSSHARRARMLALLAARHGQLRAEDLMEALCDTSGGKLAICRDDLEGITTHAAVVAYPAMRSFHVCLGLPDPQGFERLGW